MYSNIFLFVIGCFLGGIGVFGIILPIRLLLKSAYFPLSINKKAMILTACSIMAMLPFVSIFYIVLRGFSEDSQSTYYELYVRLTSIYAAEVGLGVVAGPAIFLWTRYFYFRKHSVDERRAHFVLSVGIGALVFVSIAAPYIAKWMSNASSIEISQIAKITIDTKQNAGLDAPAAVTSPSGGDIAIPYPGKDLLEALDNLKNVRSMIDRDRVYLTKTLPRVDFGSLERISAENNNDRELMKAVSSLGGCLRSYAETLSDTRLFLIDVKPVLVTLAVVSQGGKLSGTGKIQDQLHEEITGLERDVIGRLIVHPDIAAKRYQDCYVSFDRREIKIEKDYDLPYRVISLSYLLTAIGSSDTAAVALEKWISDHSKINTPSWLMLRAKLEQSYLLGKILPGSFRNEIFRNQTKSLIELYAAALDQEEIKEWTSGLKCPKYDKDKAALLFNYITQINLLVKSSSNLDNINSDILEMAITNTRIDLRCFGDYLAESTRRVWKGEFLASYASVLLARSFDDRLFGETQHPEQTHLREMAQFALYDSINILRPIVQEGRKRIDEKRASDPKLIFSQPQWEDTLRAARATLRVLNSTKRTD